MKSVKILLTTLTILAFTSAFATDRYDSDYTYARVVDVQPIYTTYQVPQNRRVCNDGYRNNYRNRPHNATHRSNGGGAIIGGIIGGLIGNRFGKKHGRNATATTAAGAIAGAAIGANAKHHRYNNRSGRNCYIQTDYYEEQRINGYDVAYEYNGRVQHTRLQNHPGDRVRVRINVQVAEY
ncbi:hypothetical protein MNBD_GAMMA01-585 [hydrothermal vent metagenome]|uniref:Glycine zipper 2TM domain-containing protein n=1 Tax=hydrothermal vent metagenome TaxID=652676 RepID=A0A3B0VEZ4_9ZZZZ